MKKILLFIMSVSLILALITSCSKIIESEPTSTPESVVESVSVSESKPESEPASTPESSEGGHAHTMSQYPYRDSNCRRNGNIEYWKCSDCGKYYSDSNGKNEITQADTVIAKKPHSTNFVEGVDSTCFEEGHISYYACDTCAMTFSDADAKTEIFEEDIVIATKPHEMTHYEEVRSKANEQGKLEHWHCTACQNYYLDADGETLTTQADLITKAPYTLVDFVVEVPDDRDPVVLHLADTQIMDLAHAPANYGGILSYWFWQHDQIYNRCFMHIKEAVEATKPDLILLTGDIVYGKFDDEGTSFTALVEFMETLEIPWAPVFGNHDNESAKGVDWQCEQFENAKNCLFMQRTLTGNGNYSVGIAQGGYITRAFYMLDTNGCQSPSNATRANTHFTTSTGLGGDQIEWYTKSITELKKSVPGAKISFGYHIPQYAFKDAYRKYGYNGAKEFIDIDAHPDKVEGDFGLIYGGMGEWDSGNKLTNAMIALGADSFFVGHEHAVSASVVHEGVRYQFGCKSSEYDYFNQLMPDGSYLHSDGKNKNDTKKSLVGGTAMVLSKEGTISNAYIYYCENGVYGDVW